MKGSEKYAINRIVAENYENLAAAIVKKAIEDYRKYLHRVLNDIHRGMAPSLNSCLKAKEVERYFLSDWHTALSTVEGQRVIEAVRDDIEEGSMTEFIYKPHTDFSCIDASEYGVFMEQVTRCKECKYRDGAECTRLENARFKIMLSGYCYWAEREEK